ncbi:MAG: ATPase, T2SS/T4P/T4SS family [Patescibacteria group bacterium]
MVNSASTQIIQVLLAKGLITPADQEKIEKESQLQKREVLDIIEEKRLVPEDALVKIKGEVFNIPVIDLTDRQIEHDVLNLVSEKIARNYNLVPFERNKDEVKVALLNPQDYKAVETLDFIARQKELHFVYFIISAYSLNSVLKQYANLSKEVSKALEDVDLLSDEPEILEDDEASKVVKNAPVSKTVSVILRHAIEGGASDIHIEPMEKETRVRYRVDGVLHMSLVLPISIHSAVVARIKVLSNLKIDETRLPQDGRFKIKFENRNVEFRVSTLPLLNREKVVMRILDSSRDTLSLENLGYRDRNLQIILRNMKNPHGLILVTGPTGSGKSTTLYSMLTLLNKEGVNIVTLEDPVEYDLPGVGQAQIRPEVGLTFASGLRSILRQDPDIIMVGEVRDKETAELAVHAALTGHMVLSTLHTNDAFGAIPRLMDMGIESFLIASSLNLVIAQRLVRKICDKCKEQIFLPREMEEEVFQEIANIPAKFIPDDIDLTRPFKMYHGIGCTHCENSGFHGRIAISEVLEVTKELKEIISAGQITNAKVVGEEIHRQGLLNMKQNGIVKSLRGLTTIEEVWNATKD